jgi:hypothetical protein
MSLEARWLDGEICYSDGAYFSMFSSNAPNVSDYLTLDTTHPCCRDRIGKAVDGILF